MSLFMYLRHYSTNYMYLGPDKVSTVVDSEDGSVSIALENGKGLVWSKSMYEFCAMEEPTTETELFDARLLRGTQVVIEAFLKEDIYISEIESILPRISNFLNEKLDAASAILWRPHMRNNPIDKSLSGLQVTKERTLNDLDSIFKSNAQDKNTDSRESDTSSSKGDSSDSGDTKG